MKTEFILKLLFVAVLLLLNVAVFTSIIANPFSVFSIAALIALISFDFLALTPILLND